MSDPILINMLIQAEGLSGKNADKRRAELEKKSQTELQALLSKNSEKPIHASGFYQSVGWTPKAKAQPKYTPAQQEAMQFMQEMLSDSAKTMDEQSKKENWISSGVNFVKETFNTEYAKSNVESAIKSTKEDFAALEDSARKIPSEFETEFQKRRGVKFDEKKIEDCSQKAKDMAEFQASTDMVDALKAKLKNALVNDTGNNINRSGEKAILETLAAMGYTKIGGVIKAAMKGHENDPAVKDYLKKGGSFAVRKGEDGKIGIYRETEKGGWQPITQEQAQIIGKEIELRLNTLHSEILGVEIPENATSEEIAKLNEQKMAQYKEDYEKSFAQAYGKKDLKQLSQNYMLSQEQGQAYVQMGVNILAMAGAMFSGGGTLALASTGVMLTNPVGFIQKATDADGMTAADWKNYGSEVVEQAGWMALGMGAGKVGDLTRSFVKVKGLSKLMKDSGKSLDDFVKIAAKSPDIPADMAKSLKTVTKLADTAGITTEVAADMATTIALQKDGATGMDWVMSIGGSLVGTKMQKVLAPMSQDAKVSHLMDAFKDFKLSENEAQQLLKAMDDAQNGLAPLNKGTNKPSFNDTKSDIFNLKEPLENILDDHDLYIINGSYNSNVSEFVKAFFEADNIESFKEGTNYYLRANLIDSLPQSAKEKFKARGIDLDKMNAVIKEDLNYDYNRKLPSQESFDKLFNVLADNKTQQANPENEIKAFLGKINPDADDAGIQKVIKDYDKLLNSSEFAKLSNADKTVAKTVLILNSVESGNTIKDITTLVNNIPLPKDAKDRIINLVSNKNLINDLESGKVDLNYAAAVLRDKRDLNVAFMLPENNVSDKTTLNTLYQKLTEKIDKHAATQGSPVMQTFIAPERFKTDETTGVQYARSNENDVFLAHSVYDSSDSPAEDNIGSLLQSLNNPSEKNYLSTSLITEKSEVFANDSAYGVILKNRSKNTVNAGRGQVSGYNHTFESFARHLSYDSVDENATLVKQYFKDNLEQSGIKLSDSEYVKLIEKINNKQYFSQLTQDVNIDGKTIKAEVLRNAAENANKKLADSIPYGEGGNNEVTSIVDGVEAVYARVDDISDVKPEIMQLAKDNNLKVVLLGKPSRQKKDISTDVNYQSELAVLTEKFKNKEISAPQFMSAKSALKTKYQNIANTSVDHSPARVSERGAAETPSLDNQAQVSQPQTGGRKLENLVLGEISSKFNNPEINKQLLEIQDTMGKIKDKELVKLINNKFESIKGDTAEPTKALQDVQDMIDLYHTLNGDYANIEGKVSRSHLNNYAASRPEASYKQYYNYLKQVEPHLAEELKKDPGFLDKLLKRDDYKEFRQDFQNHVKAHKLIEFLKYNKSEKELGNYFYEKYYLKNANVPKDIKAKCLSINEKYGTKVFPSSFVRDADKVLDYIDKELGDWTRVSNGEAKLPPLISYLGTDKIFLEGAGAYASQPSGALFINDMTEWSTNENLRHEITHTNDTNNGKPINRMPVPEEMAPKIKVTDPKTGDVSYVVDVENCSYKDEFLNAGLDMDHVKYAATSSRELIAVASQGDMSKYSPEFKQQLIDMGMPEWAFKLSEPPSPATVSDGGAAETRSITESKRGPVLEGGVRADELDEVAPFAQRLENEPHVGDYVDIPETRLNLKEFRNKLSLLKNSEGKSYFYSDFTMDKLAKQFGKENLPEISAFIDEARTKFGDEYTANVIVAIAGNNDVKPDTAFKLVRKLTGEFDNTPENVSNIESAVYSLNNNSAKAAEILLDMPKRENSVDRPWTNIEDFLNKAQKFNDKKSVAALERAVQIKTQSGANAYDVRDIDTIAQQKDVIASNIFTDEELFKLKNTIRELCTKQEDLGIVSKLISLPENKELQAQIKDIINNGDYFGIVNSMRTLKPQLTDKITYAKINDIQDKNLKSLVKRNINKINDPQKRRAYVESMSMYLNGLSEVQDKHIMGRIYRGASELADLMNVDGIDVKIDNYLELSRYLKIDKEFRGEYAYSYGNATEYLDYMEKEYPEQAKIFKDLAEKYEQLSSEEYDKYLNSHPGVANSSLSDIKFYENVPNFVKDKKIQELKNYMRENFYQERDLDYSRQNKEAIKRLYTEKYLTLLPEAARERCERIYDSFGVKMFLANENDTKSLDFIYNELLEWQKVSKGKATLPPTIDLSLIKQNYIDKAFKAGGFHEHDSHNISVQGYLNDIKHALRHEIAHANDSKIDVGDGIITVDNKDGTTEEINIDEIIVHKTAQKYDENGKPMLNPDGSPVLVKMYADNGTLDPDMDKCKFVDEFVNAGISERQIKYAYTNKKEFLAVASEGDYSQYSPEFKELLVKLGLPDWMFKMKNKESITTDANLYTTKFSEKYTAEENQKISAHSEDFYNWVVKNQAEVDKDYWKNFSDYYSVFGMSTTGGGTIQTRVKDLAGLNEKIYREIDRIDEKIADLSDIDKFNKEKLKKGDEPLTQEAADILLEKYNAQKQSLINDYDTVRNTIQDAYGARLVLDDTSPASIAKVHKSLLNAIDSGDIKILEINNYQGEGGIPYFSSAQVKQLQAHCRRQGYELTIISDVNAPKGKEGTYQKDYNSKKAVKASGYTTFQVNIQHKSGVISEFQIRGKHINELAESEHIFYDISQNKDLSKGNPAIKELTDPLVAVVKEMNAEGNEEIKKAYSEYLTECYKYARMQELNIPMAKPVLPPIVNPMLDIDNIIAIHAQMAALK